MIIIIGIGGTVGAICRYLLYVWLTKSTTSFSYGTWLANVTGALLLGFIFPLYVSEVLSGSLWLLLGVGLLGSYTTLSTFGFEVVTMIQLRKYKQALLYIGSSVTLGLCAVWVGSQFGVSILN